MNLSPRNRQKAVEAILLVAAQLPALTRHTLAKVFYFADKAHLQNYGRLICADCYIAMRNGPVPSSIYDIVKSPEVYAPDAIESGTGMYVKAKRQPNSDFLSASENKCLLEAAREFGHKSFSDLTEISHDYAWNQANENDEISIFDMARTVQDSDSLIQYLRA